MPPAIRRTFECLVATLKILIGSSRKIQQQITVVVIAFFSIQLNKQELSRCFNGEQNVNSIMKCWHAFSKEMSSLHEKNYAK